MNLKVKHENYNVRVRDKIVAFDNKTINGVYGMSHYEIGSYQILIGKMLEYDNIMKYLGVP